ncbi:unnamed protein product [Psylliodes chrysocephalus]|uniref:Uncharacterized protein n=1 Tax=Psylliodes chrysocephalus TaxID=3402493 RepID=A0A9P0CXK9_9CUCU|nr:unnamed protein product [Psylliodes chrysocephala]
MAGIRDRTKRLFLLAKLQKSNNDDDCSDDSDVPDPYGSSDSVNDPSYSPSDLSEPDSDAPAETANHNDTKERHYREQLKCVEPETKSSIKKVKTDEEDWFCDTCKLLIKSKLKSSHLRSIAHKSLSWVPENEEIEVCRTACGRKVVTYRISNKKNLIKLKKFFDDIKIKLTHLIQHELTKHTCLKGHFELFALYQQPSKEIREIKSLITKNNIITHSTDLDELLEKTYLEIYGKSQDFQERLSGFRATGLHPENPDEVLKRISGGIKDADIKRVLDNGLIDLLKEHRRTRAEKKYKRGKKLNLDSSRIVTDPEVSENPPNVSGEFSTSAGEPGPSSVLPCTQQLSI